ncbi:MAG: hypothetical protein L3J62_01065 [Gammaproteobacteria bacterium]|nr:hypothetical protein [Gammaproteobacteria bacterium]MCF6229374.1 hypothetical protein [Gammaproteobacteria bacterium]
MPVDLFRFFSPAGLLLVLLLILSGCTSLGPVGAPGFDDEFSRTIAPGEQLEHYAPCYLYAGTYMDGKPFTVPVYEGVLVMTDQRIIFTQWDASEKYYKPRVWIKLSDIRRVKKQHDSLLRYVAVEGRDMSRNAYHMMGPSVDLVYEKIRASVKSRLSSP